MLRTLYIRPLKEVAWNYRSVHALRSYKVWNTAANYHTNVKLMKPIIAASVLGSRKDGGRWSQSFRLVLSHSH